jgi:hypothetical protein
MPPETTQADSGTGSPDSLAKTSQVDESAKPKSQNDDQKDQGDDSELDVSKLDPKVQKLIKNLRQENGEHRTKNKALGESHGKLKQALVDAGIIEDDEVDPKEKLEQVSAGLQGAQLNSAILEAAVEHGIGKEDLRYFKFLVSEKFGSLEEDQELTEDDLAELAAEARGRKSGNDGTTSVGGGTPPPPGKGGDVTLEQFVSMTTAEKSLIFQKNLPLYERLFSEAKAKKLLFK